MQGLARPGADAGSPSLPAAAAPTSKREGHSLQVVAPLTADVAPSWQATQAPPLR
jgi:hypothetical protein